MSTFLLHISKFFQRHTWWSWLIIACILTVSLTLASRMKFKEDINQLIPKSEQSLITQDILKTVDFTDKIIVNIGVEEGGNEDKLVAFAENFLEKLQDSTAFEIKKVQGKVAEEDMLQTYDFIYEHLPLFLNERDYKTIEKKLHQDSIAQIVKSSYKSLISPAGLITKQYIIKDPLQLTSLGLEKLKRLQVGDDFDLYKGFLLTNNRKNILLFISPKFKTSNSAKSEILSENLYKLVNELNENSPDVKANLLGSMLYAVANAKQIKQDIQYTISFALVLLLVILISFYKKIYIPLILFIPTLIGATVAIGILALFKTQISLISLGIGSILLGITLDYALHTLTHSRESLTIKELYKQISPSILVSSVTTATAFFCLFFVKSEALKDLGLFAAISVIVAAFSALIVIPQLYKPQKKNKNHQTWLDRFSKISLEENKWLVGGVVVIFIIGLFFFQKVGFDEDLSNLNYQPEVLAKAEAKLQETAQTSFKSLYVVSYAEEIEGALQTNHKLFEKLQTLEKKNEIERFSSLGGIVLSDDDQQRKINTWKTFWNANRVDSLQMNFKKAGGEVGFKENTFNNFYNTVNKEYKSIYLNEYQKVSNLFIDEFLTTAKDEKLSTVLSIVQVNETQREAFTNFIEKENGVLAIDKKALNESLLGTLQSDFSKLISYSFVAIFIILWLAFRQIELVVITLIPIAITWVISLFCMYMLSIPFNILNIIISTFIFGLGIDYSIFITNGLQYQYLDNQPKLATYRSSIVLSVITTLLGMGVLIFAKHPALISIATVSIIGVLTAALVSFTLQPWLFMWAITNRAKKGLAPLQLQNFVMTSLGFIYFGVGAFMVSTLSFIFLPILPFRKEKKMRYFHQIISSLMGSVLATNPFVKKKSLNFSEDIWTKPSILIANHSSFLDILSLGKLNPKLIFLVNDWVYNSPVFGKAVKLAGFYPVSNGIDDGIAHLQQKVDEGYSLIAFPEGSRSLNNKINRFHKGSFYLAEKLQIPITPILIHGASEVLPKGDFTINKGKITLKCLPQIDPKSSSFGTGYREQCKSISAYFRKEYQKLKDRVEQEGYFKNYLLSNYRYTSLYKKMKREYVANIDAHLKISNSLQEVKQLVIWDSSYGMWSIYHQIRRPYMKVNAVFATTEEKQITAARRSVKHLKVNLFNLTEFEWEKATHLLIDRNQLTKLPVEKSKNLQVIYVMVDKETDFKEFSGFTLYKKEEGLLILMREKGLHEE